MSCIQTSKIFKGDKTETYTIIIFGHVEGDVAFSSQITPVNTNYLENKKTDCNEKWQMGDRCVTRSNIS